MAFSFYRSVTVDHTKVGSADLTNFAVLVSGTYSYLATVGNGGKVQNANGYDVGFYSDAALTTKLDWETEIYTASNGVVVYWVRISSISHTVDTVFYLAYGDSGISTDQSNKTGVWDSNFKFVSHLADGTTLSVSDSTASPASPTNHSATAVAGEIDGGAQFVAASSQYIDVGNPSKLQITGQITLESWVNMASFSTGGFSQDFVGKGYDGSVEGYLLRYTVGSAVLETGSYNGTVFGTTWAVSGWSTGTWHHVAGVYDGTNWKLYFDGSQVASNSGASGALSTSKGVGIGGVDISGSFQRFVDGKQDEVRISNTGRPAGYFLAEYNNASSPSTFYAVGSEVPVGGGGRVSRPSDLSGLGGAGQQAFNPSLN